MLEVVVSERGSSSDLAMVRVNGKLSRIVINKRAMADMTEQFGQEVNHVLLLRDKDIQKCMWIRAANPEERGARKLGSTKGSTRLVSCGAILRLVGYKETSTLTFPISWDPENLAFKVDMSEEECEKMKT